MPRQQETKDNVASNGEFYSVRDKAYCGVFTQFTFIMESFCWFQKNPYLRFSIRNFRNNRELIFDQTGRTNFNSVRDLHFNLRLVRFCLSCYLLELFPLAFEIVSRYCNQPFYLSKLAYCTVNFILCFVKIII